MKKISKQELKQILEDHREWLNNPTTGKKANLHGADLRCANLHGTDLRFANLRCANLRCANLHGANLRDANLRDANLSDAILHGTDLRCANLIGANLSGANLHGTDLLTFQYQKHRAYCTGERLIIGCKDKSLAEWSTEFETIGKKHDYSEIQISMYGKFIEMCIEHAATNET